jgi:hypothetical protein
MRGRMAVALAINSEDLQALYSDEFYNYMLDDG